MPMAAKRFQRAINRETGAPEAEQDAYQRVTDFDASQAVGDVAQAGFSRFREDLGKEIEALRGRSVGQGRLDSGFEWEDEGDVVQTLGDRLNREVAGASVQTAGIEAGNRQTAAGLASDRTGRYYDMLSADRDSETAELSRKRQKRSGLASGIGSLLGAGVGALVPGGGLAGAKLGGALGGQFGRLF